MKKSAIGIALFVAGLAVVSSGLAQSVATDDGDQPALTQLKALAERGRGNDKRRRPPIPIPIPIPIPVPVPQPIPGPYPGPHHPGQAQTLVSAGSYAFSSEAETAKDQAVAALQSIGIPVFESRVEYDSGYRFVVVYSAREPLYVEQYRGGKYSFSSDAKNAAEQTAAALAGRGKVILEKAVFYDGGHTYIVSYLARHPGQAQTLVGVGSYSFPSEAEAAKDQAVAALRGIGITVLESRVEYDSGYRFVIAYSAREPLYVEKYHGGKYSFPSDAKEAAERTAAALTGQGRVVLEKAVLYDGGYTYILSYVTRRW